jgi:hypothetical protein
MPLHEGNKNTFQETDQYAFSRNHSRYITILEYTKKARIKPGFLFFAILLQEKIENNQYKFMKDIVSFFSQKVFRISTSRFFFSLL